MARSVRAAGLRKQVGHAPGLAELGPRTELLILGAGPAGMGAAIAASELGIQTLVVDENPAPGDRSTAP